MANKLSAIIARLDLGLRTLVAAGHVKAVYRAFVDPVKAPQKPVVALYPSSFGRDGGQLATGDWSCDLSVQLVREQGADEKDETGLLDLVAEVDEAIRVVADADAAGGFIDRPRWEPWEAVDQGVLRNVGALGTLRIRVQGPLKLE